MQVFTVGTHIPSKILKITCRENEVRYMGSIFGPVLTNLGQIIIKVNVEILILKVTMFNLDSLEKGAFYFIHKCYCVMVFRSFSGTILENYFGQDLLYVRVSYYFSSGAWDAVIPLVGARCTILVGSISRALETITF